MLYLDEEAARPWTDGRALHLVPGDAAGMRRQVLAQAALIAAGSLNAEVLRSLVGRARLADRYLAFEAQRAAQETTLSWPSLAWLMNVPTPQAASDSPSSSLELARGRGPVPSLASHWGQLQPRAVIALPVGSRTASLKPRAVAQGGASKREDESHSIFRRRGQLVRRSRPTVDATIWAEGATPSSTGGSLVNVMAGGSLRGERKPTWWRAEGPVAPASPLQRTAFLYPEWDDLRGRYQHDWCTVRERTADRVGPPAGAARHDGLRRALAPLGLAWERARRRPAGDDLDLDAVVGAGVDLVSGDEPSPLLYVERVRRRRDLAVLVLVDASASARDRAFDGRRVHDHQLDAAAALVDTLQALGDRVALYAFRSRGRATVDFLKIKPFETRFDGRANASLAGVEPRDSSRIGAGVRHAVHVLRSQAGTSHMLLVVVSDGFAHDDGYEGRRGRSDARRSLAEARRQGIGCLCLTMAASDTDDDLHAVFGASSHARADGIDDLAPMMGRLVREALTTADRSRRNNAWGRETH